MVLPFPVRHTTANMNRLPEHRPSLRRVQLPQILRYTKLARTVAIQRRHTSESLPASDTLVDRLATIDLSIGWTGKPPLRYNPIWYKGGILTLFAG